MPGAPLQNGSKRARCEVRRAPARGDTKPDRRRHIRLCEILPKLQKAGAFRGSKENQKYKVLPGRVPENLPEPQPVPVDYQRL